MKIKRLMEFASASVLSVSTLMTLAVPLAHAAALTCTWTGATDLKFSTATNWAGCTGASNPAGVPVTGDTIAFGTAASSTQINLVNDLTGVTFGGVTSNVVTNLSQYKIDTIVLAAGAQLGVAAATTCNPYFARLQYGTLSDAGTLLVYSDAHDLSSTAAAVGGDVTISNTYGTGALALATGSTVGGKIVVTSPVTLTSATGCGTGGGGGLPSGSNFAGFTMHGLTLQNGAITNLADVAFPITLGGGTSTTAPILGFFGNFDSNTSYVATSYTISGAVTLLHDTTVYVGEKTSVNLTGAISGAGFAITKDNTSPGTITFAPSSNDSTTVAGTPTNPTKTTTVSDDQSAKNFTVVPNETLIVDGQAGYVGLLSGSKLMGTGKVNGLQVETGAMVAPGHSPGCITDNGVLFLYGTYQAEIGGTDPCTGYDQIRVTGTVNLTGSTLNVPLFGGFVPKVGQSYIIIANDAADDVAGTFTGIAEGGTYSNQGITYTVTYKGDTGNDVVLTVKSVDAAATPKKPDTGFALVAAHPLVSFLSSTFAALAIIVMARRLNLNTK